MIDPQIVEIWFAPVFEWQGVRFAWFDQTLVSDNAEAAKDVGLKLEKGYIEKNAPIKAVHTVARFAASGNYAMAELGPEEEERPVILINPSPEAIDAVRDPATPEARPQAPEPVEEIPYDIIADDGLVKSVSF